jgi:arsenical-resistance protein 2
MESLVLFKDITGWAKAGGGFVEWIDEYDAAVWESK